MCQNVKKQWDYFVFHLLVLFSTKVCASFGTRKKKFQKWLLNDLLGYLCLCSLLHKNKQTETNKKPPKTQCTIFMKVAIKLCGFVLWWVILFHVLKTTKATLPIYQHTFETLAKTILVGRPWVASGWTGSKWRSLCWRDGRHRSVTYETAKAMTRGKWSMCQDEQQLRP